MLPFPDAAAVTQTGFHGGEWPQKIGLTPTGRVSEDTALQRAGVGVFYLCEEPTVQLVHEEGSD